MTDEDTRERLLKTVRPFLLDQVGDLAFDGIKHAVANEFNVQPESITAEIINGTHLKLDLPDHSFMLEYRVAF